MTATASPADITRHTLLVGLTGAAGAGKTTVAGILCDDLSWAEVPLAEPIQEAVLAIMAAADVDGAWAVERDLKERPMPRLGVSYRQLAQTLGDWGRSIRPDWWVSIAMHRAAQARSWGDSVVISDVRYPNEAAAIRAAGGLIVRVRREGLASVREHSSERHSAHIYADFELDNTGSRLDLADAVGELVDAARRAKGLSEAA